MPISLADDIVASAHLVRDLAAREEVSSRWSEESSCAGMTVGGLTVHLLGQLGAIQQLMGPGREPPGSAPVYSLLGHYREAAWANTGLDEEVNVSIRERDDAKAAAGPAAVLAQSDEVLAALPEILAGIDEDEPVLVPWQGWSLRAHDFVVTRLMEMVVHADDLAVSVDLPVPVFPAPAGQAAVGLLAAVSLDRNGQDALVRGLSRPQRAPAEGVSAF